MCALKRKNWLKCLASGVVLFQGGGLFAANPCEQTWTVAQQTWNCDGTVICSTVWDPDGGGPKPSMLVVGGSFSEIGNVRTPGVAAFDGTNWFALGAGLSGGPQTLEVIDGQLFAGGGFASSGGVTCRGLAKWNGTTWQEFGGGVTGTVRAIKSFQGDLVVAGSISKFAGESIVGLARYRNGQWQKIGSGGAVAITAMDVFGGELYVTGAFTNYGGVSASRIARTDGVNWMAVGAGVVGTPTCLAAGGTELVVGGPLTVAGGSAAKNFAAWDGTTWTVRTNDEMTSVTSLRAAGGVVFATGLFEDATTSVPTVGKLEAGTWVSMNQGFVVAGKGQSGPCTMTAEFAGSLYVGGPRAFSAGIADSVARRDEGVWKPVRLANSGFVRQVVAYHDELFAIGLFTRFGDEEAKSVAVWDRAAWRALLPSLQGSATAAGVVGDELWFVGDLRTSGAATSSVARWNGADLVPVGAKLLSAPDGVVEFDGQAIVFGNRVIGAAGGGSSPVAFWSGAQWLPFGSGLNGWATQAVVLDGALVLTGTTLSLPGGGTVELVRWDGSMWSKFAPGLGASTRRKMIVHDGKLVVTEPDAFYPVGQWTGTNWVTVGNNLSGAVSSLLSAGRDLYATGSLFVNSAGGSKRTELARWNGTVWTAVDHPLTGLSIMGGFGQEVVFGGAMKTKVESRSVAVAVLSAARCVGDMNCDGMLTMEDFDAFVGAFEAGEAAADRNEDGFLTFDDFDVFVDAYERGC